MARGRSPFNLISRIANRPRNNYYYSRRQSLYSPEVEPRRGRQESDQTFEATSTTATTTTTANPINVVDTAIDIAENAFGEAANAAVDLLLTTAEPETGESETTTAAAEVNEQTSTAASEADETTSATSGASEQTTTAVQEADETTTAALEANETTTAALEANETT